MAIIKFNPEEFDPAEITPLDPTTGVIRGIGDVALNLGKGAANITKAYADSVGANNTISKFAQTAADFLDKGISQGAKDQEAINQFRSQAAEGKGAWEEVKAAGANFFDSPLDSTANAMGSIIPTVAIAKAGKKAGLNPMKTATGAGLVMGAGVGKGAIYDEVERAHLDAGKSPEEAARLATEAQSYGGDNTDMIALASVLGGATSSVGAEKLILSGLGKKIAERAAKDVATKIAKDTAIEAIPEGVQGGQEKFAGNLAVQREGFDRDLMAGVYGAGTAEALAGAGVGAGVSAVDSYLSPREKLKKTLEETQGGAITDAAIKATETGATDATGATPALGLPNYAGEPLVTFPDGSTMTQAEAEQRRFDERVGVKNVSEQNATPDVAAATGGSPDNQPAGGAATGVLESDAARDTATGKLGAGDQQNNAAGISDGQQYSPVTAVDTAANEAETSRSSDSILPLSGNVDTVPSEIVVNSGRGNAKRVGDLFDVETLKSKGFGGIDTPSQRVVVSAVLTGVNNGKILDSVIGSDVVDMVNMLTGKQFTPDMLRDNPSVLKDILPVAANIDISSLTNEPVFNRLTANISKVASTIAELPLIGDVANSATNLAAMDAGEAGLSETDSTLLGAEIVDAKLGNLSVKNTSAKRAGNRPSVTSIDGIASPAANNLLGLSGTERQGTDKTDFNHKNDSNTLSGENANTNKTDSVLAVRPIVESIAKRRAAAQQMNKEKAFDTALGIAKRMLSGEQVKPGQLQMAARQLKNDAELFDQVSKLVEIAKAPAKTARAERAQSADGYRSRISQAKTEEELQAIAAEIAKDAKLTDTQAADLDDAVMEAMDALDDSGLNDAEEKLAEQIADEVVAEVEADPSALEPKPGDSENAAYLKEQVNERIEQEDGKQAVTDAERQAEAPVADGGKESGEEVEASEVNVESDLSRVDAGKVLINAKDGYRIQKVGDKYHYSAAGNAEFKTEKLTRDELVEKLAGKKMPTTKAEDQPAIGSSESSDIVLPPHNKYYVSHKEIYGSEQLVSISPLPGRSFSEQEKDSLIEWSRSLGYKFRGFAKSKIKLSINSDSLWQEILSQKDYERIIARKERQINLSEQVKAEEDYLSSAKSTKFVEALFSDSIDHYQTYKMVRFLDGAEDKYNGMPTPKMVSAAKDAGINLDGIQKNSEFGIAVRNLYENLSNQNDDSTKESESQSADVKTPEQAQSKPLISENANAVWNDAIATRNMATYREYNKQADKDSFERGFKLAIDGMPLPKEAIENRALDEGYSTGARWGDGRKETESVKDEVDKAKEALREAGVKGKDFTDAVKDVRQGNLTADEVAEAHGQKIEDVGEKMAGARKDMEIAARKEWSDEELANEPLSKIWPAGDIDAIDDAYTAAWSYASRAEIPAKPRKSYKLAWWVAKVKLLREFNTWALDGTITKELIQGKMKDFPVLKDFEAKVRLLEKLPRDQWKRIGKVAEWPNAYTYGADRSTKIPTPQVHVEIDGANKMLRGSSVEEVLDDVNDALGQAAPEKRMEFQVRGSGSKFHIYKKGDSQYHKLAGPFGEPKEAFNYIKESYDDLVAAWDGVKDRENIKKTDVRGKGNKARTGENWRNGKNVTPEQFAEQFGFRGVEFGNWVSQGQGNKDRQGLLNQAYDGLMDLASIVGIPPKAISLNGSLGLAFGSRGKGWAAAHFEPGNLVINLTKTKGAGSLAHEWFHALDNYFSRMRGGEIPIERGLNAQEAYRRQNFITYRPEPLYVHKSQPSKGMTAGNLRRYRELSKGSNYYAEENWQKDPKHPNGVRPEVESAFAAVVEALDASPMNARSKGADKGNEGYWSRIIERAARSFENYIIHKMRLNGYDNEYLANVTSPEDFPRNAEIYPYLLETEIQPVADAFDNLFSTIQTKETEKGVAMFSRYRTSAPIFYSQLARGIDSAKFETAPAAQWKLWLQSNAGKLGIKKDEIQWTGVTDWLDLQTGKVSKADVQAYLDGNGVQVEEVMLGEMQRLDFEEVESSDEGFDQYYEASFETKDRYTEKVGIAYSENAQGWWAYYRGEAVAEDVATEQAAKDAVFEAAREDMLPDNAGTKYATYTVPGGENYRELLLTLPEKQGNPTRWQVKEGGKVLNVFESKEKADDFVRRNDSFFRGLRVEAVGNDTPGFRSSHFDQPNILAHVRFDERTDADGNRVLFINEIQSDWGQDGKKKGFANGRKAEPLTAEEDAELMQLYDLRDSRTPQQTARMHVLNDRMNAIDKKGGELGVPSAPFVTDTKAWVSLAVKRMMRYAAENGFDRVAFINGQQAADLYDLSKHIDSIEWLKNDRGYAIAADKNGITVIEKSGLSESELVDTVGKEVAEKITSSAKQSGKLTGLDLKVGGEGMLHFYNAIVPQVVNDVLKKIGGGKVERLVIGKKQGLPIVEVKYINGNGWSLIDEDGEIAKLGQPKFYSNEEAFDWWKEYSELAETGMVQTGFTITPDMRDKIMSGLPLFGRQFSGSGMAVADVERAVNRIRAGWKNAPEIIVVDNMNDSRIRKAVRDENERQLSQGAQGQPEGFYDARKVYIVASELNSEKDVVRVLFHETLGHAGLRGVYGSELGKILDQVAMMRKKDIAAKAKQYGLDATNPADRRIAAEEVLAEMAQTNPQIGFVKRAIAAIRNFLRKHVPYFKNLELTDADIIQGYLLPARRFVQNGKKANDVRGMVAAFVRNYDDLYAAMLPNWGVKAEYQGETGVYNGARAIKNKFVALVMPEVVDHIHGLQGGGDRIVEFEIRETKHGDRIGSATIEMRGNKPVALHDIAIDRAYRGNGYAKQVVGALLSAAPGRSMEIIEILDSAEDFWRKSGVHTIGYTDGNATLTWRDFAEANPEARGGKENQHGSFSRSASRGDAEASAYETADAGSEYVRQRPAVDQTQTQQFRNWFGDSVVTDNGKPMSEGGKPLVVYHGTTEDFDSFDIEASTDGVAGWFTTSKEHADVHVRELQTNRQERERGRRYLAGGRILPVFATIKKPLQVDEGELKDRAVSEIVADAKRNGHDGLVIYRKQEGDTVYVAFRPEQIKSVFNRGTFDPANPDIRFSRSAAFDSVSGVLGFNAETAGTRASGDWVSESKIDDLIYTLQDKHVDLKRVQQAIQEQSGDIEDGINAYMQEELFHGRSANKTKNFIDDELTPLIDDMRERDVKMADFEEYLWARHAEERNIQIAKVNPDMPDGGSGMTTQEARDYLAGLSRLDRANFEALAKHIDKINAKTRQSLVAYGLESQDTIDAWGGAYSNYVPLMREDMDHPSGLGTGQGYSVRGNASKRATGSNRAVVDIVANIAQQRERTIIRGEKNRVALALLGLAKKNPNRNFWNVDEPPTVKTVVNDRVVTMVDPNYKSRDNVVIARYMNDKGKVIERSVVFNEQNPRALRMAQSIKNLDQDQLGEVLGAAAKVTRYFSSINTQYNPVFGVINLLRDTQGAMLNLSSTPIAGKQADVSKKVMSALKGIYSDIRRQRKGLEPNSQWSNLWEEFQREGGQTGYRDLFRNARERAEAIEKSLNPDWWMEGAVGKVLTANGYLAAPERVLADNVVKPVFEWLSDYNESMENAVRLAAYKVALDSGISRQQAASIAKNLTVNFNRRGEAGRQIGALYAFFNASVQGTARIAETLSGRAGRRILQGGLLLGVMQAFMLAGFDDDEPPQWERDRNLIIPTGDGTYIKIAMPLGFNALPAFGRIMTEWAMDGFSKPGERMVHIIDMLLDVTNPIGNAGLSLQTIAPTIIDPLAALAENEDWSGRPIAREDFNSLDPTPGFTRAKDSAWAGSMLLAEAINAMTGGTAYKPGAFSPTPDQLDYLIGQLTGGVGRELMKSQQTVTSLVTGDDLPTYKIPLFGRFIGNTEGMAQQGAEFYNNLRELNMHENEIQGRRKAGEDVSEYLQYNPEARLVMLAKHSESLVRKLRKHRRLLKEQGADKEQIVAIDEQITIAMKRFNDAIYRIKNPELV